MILLIDNYDSFTYNLYQYLCELGADVQVARNDKISLEEIENMAPDGIVVSPGPCTPKEAGISGEVVKRFGEKLPVLGVCLGHQTIGYAYGGVVERAPEIMHGKTSMVHHDGKGVYEGAAKPLRGHPVSFIDGQPGYAAGIPGGDVADGGRNSHGGAAQDPARRGGAVPSGVDNDEGGA